MRAISALIEAEKEDRKAGFLTKTERQYLTGDWAPGDSPPGEWTEQQGRTKRSDIKTRSRHALADIALLQKYGDSGLLRNIIEREQSTDDDIPTFYDETLDNARKGASAFMIRLGLGPENKDQADELIEWLHGEDLVGLLQEMANSNEDSMKVAEEHEDALKPIVEQLHTYAEANDISWTEMLDAIFYHWPE